MNAVCSDCDAIVRSPQRHQQWHDNLTRSLELLGAELDTLTGRVLDLDLEIAKVTES